MAIILTLALSLVPTAPDAPTWSRLPDLPIGLGGPAVGVHGRTLICTGGSYFPVSLFEGGTKRWVGDIQVLEYGAEVWRPAGKLSHPLAYAGVVPAVDGPILIGGSDGQQHYRDVFRLSYNGVEVVRHELPPLSQPIAYAAVARSGDVIYVAGARPRRTRRLARRWASCSTWPRPSRPGSHCRPGPVPAGCSRPRRATAATSTFSAAVRSPRSTAR